MPPEANVKEWPYVTVQLPIYNELYVVDRLIESVAAFDYPKDLFEIQVLDDSTDETYGMAAKKVREVSARGIDISHIHRTDRKGFKAGALAEGMKAAKGEFLAVFDADFVPHPDFLKKTIPSFEDEKTGAVQAKWDHLNEHYSLLTKLQAFGLDGHFTIEQQGRNAGGYFINFNGTAGVWRKKCIEDAGGWSSDTLTEDLDLSYRSQLKGWKFKYLEDVEAPAELPAAINAVKSQQYRWNKGAAENVKKNLWPVFLSSYPWSNKLHALFHIGNSSIFICVFLTAFLSIPILWIKGTSPEYSLYFMFATYFLFSLGILSVFYWRSSLHKHKNVWMATGRFFLYFPLFLALYMGLSLHNTIGVLEGYFGRKTPFIRTPKFNITKDSNDLENNKYLTGKINPLTIAEGLLCIYFAGGFYVAYKLDDFGLFPYHALLVIGFGMLVVYSVFHTRFSPAK